MSANKGARVLAILSRCMWARLRMLVHVRDLYVNSMTGCAGRRSGGLTGLVAVPRSQSHGFYRSSTGRDDVRELIRAASRAGPPRPAGVAARSQSVAVGRIDEDKPCEFGLEDGAKLGLGPRSKSCAVAVPSRTARVGGLA